MRSWDIAVSVQTSSKPSNCCTEQNRLNKKKENKPCSVTASVITLLLQQLSKMALVSLGTHCFLSGWYREILQWIQYSWFVFKTKCCCIQIPHSFTNKAISILGVQRLLLGWGWQSNKTDSDIRAFQAGWFKAALRQKVFFILRQLWQSCYEEKNRLLLVFWKWNVLFKWHFTFQLVDAFQLDLHQFLY